MKKNCFSDQVINYILSRDREQLKELTIREITAYFGVSKVYLIKKFKDQKGITPGKFILREKMIQAAFLMENHHNLTVKELAEMAGFSSSNYFIRVFKEHLGISPCQYRDVKMASSRGEYKKK